MPSDKLIMKLLVLVLFASPAAAANRTACDDVPPRQAKIQAAGDPASRAFCARTNVAFDFDAQAKRFLPQHLTYMADASLPEEARRAVKASYEQIREAFNFLRDRRRALCADKPIDATAILRPVPANGLQASLPAFDLVDAAVQKHQDTLKADLEGFGESFLGARNNFTMTGKIGAAASRASGALSSNFHDDFGEQLLVEVKSNLPSGLLSRNEERGANAEPFGVFSAPVQEFAKEMNFYDDYSSATFDLRLCAKKLAADHLVH